MKSRNLLLGAALLLCCLTPLRAQTYSTTSHPIPRTVHTGPPPRAAVWSWPRNTPNGFSSSQHGGRRPWAGNRKEYKDSDAGGFGLGAKGWVKVSGSWVVDYTYIGHGRPPASVYHVVYSVSCDADGTGAIAITKSPSETYWVAGKVVHKNGLYYLEFHTVNVSAEVAQTSNLSSWSGNVGVRVLDTVQPTAG